MNEERRKYKRYDVPLFIEFIKADDGKRFYSGSTVNFSRSGLCLKTDYVIPDLKGDLELKIKMPGKDVSTPAIGNIVWAEHGEKQSLLGIHLMAMDKEDKLQILDYCEQL